MSGFARIFVTICIVLLFIGLPAVCMNANAEGQLESAASVFPLSVNGVDDVGLNPNGVVEIMVTEHSAYVIDPRFNLCFYETRNPYGVAAVEVPCSKFEMVVQGLRK